MIYDFRMFLCVCVCVLLLSAPARGGRWQGERGVEEGWEEGVERGLLLWGVRFSFVGKLLKPFAFAFCLCFDVCVRESMCANVC